MTIADVPPETFLAFVAVGFTAQLVDGALGMAFGVISSTLLLSLGIPPAAASASVHAVETFTTGASGLSHLFHKNIDRNLFFRLAIPGIFGGVLGAAAITSLNPTIAKPIVTIYLLLVGISLLWRGIVHGHQERRVKFVGPLGLLAGFLDAAGGGGWGPIATSNLLIQGASPRKVIGSVNSAEFFVTVAISSSFSAMVGFAAFSTSAIGVLVGGLLASPFGGWAAKRVQASRLLILIGITLTLTSCYGLYTVLRT